MAMFDWEEMAQKLGKAVIEEYEYKGKTLAQWVEEIKARQWISVEEKLPERRGQQCLCICQYEKHVQAPGCTIILTWEGAGDNGYVDRPHFSNEGFCEMYVTHWMPLPEPPKEG